MNINHMNNTVVSNKTPETDKQGKELKQACADFEAVLLNSMFQSMRKTLTGDDIFGHSFQKEIYESMFDQQISTDIARGKGMGIGEALYRQLKKQG